jgi:hypothetical protein
MLIAISSPDLSLRAIFTKQSGFALPAQLTQLLAVFLAINSFAWFTGKSPESKSHRGSSAPVA